MQPGGTGTNNHYSFLKHHDPSTSSDDLDRQRTLQVSVTVLNHAGHEQKGHGVGRGQPVPSSRSGTVTFPGKGVPQE